jgi:dinuclear metal center YbgI/SA1388 family protein
MTVTVADVVRLFDRHYPPAWAQAWDRVGLVIGDPGAPVRRVLFAVDCVPETAEEAVAAGADLIVAHHPLLLRGVSSVAATTYKGRIVHSLIRAGVALFVAHTNADIAAPGVSDALAERLGLSALRPLRPAEGGPGGPTESGPTEGGPGGPMESGPGGRAESGATGRGDGRIGVLPEPLPLARFADLAARRLPATAWGVRAAGDPDRMVRTVAVCGGAGDSLLADATEAGVDAFLTADLRHHPASEHLANGGPALLDAAHWATERPWLDQAARLLRAVADLETAISDLVTDPWTIHKPSSIDRPPSIDPPSPIDRLTEPARHADGPTEEDRT